MANHASAKKAYKQSVKKALVNKNRKSRIKTYLKKVHKAIEGGTKEEALAALSSAQSEIMKGVIKKVYKPNTASRIIKRLAAKLKTSLILDVNVNS